MMEKAFDGTLTLKIYKKCTVLFHVHILLKKHIRPNLPDHDEVFPWDFSRHWLLSPLSLSSFLPSLNFDEFALSLFPSLSSNRLAPRWGWRKKRKSKLLLRLLLLGSLRSSSFPSCSSSARWAPTLSLSTLLCLWESR